MLADFGIAPSFLTIIVFSAFAVLTDFLLELFSLRMTLATGYLQHWLFYNHGRGLLADSAISSCFQFLSFRKRAYFLQMISFFNVGAFTRKQMLVITFGAFIGMGLSSFMLVFPHPYLALGLVLVGFLLNILAVDHFRDIGVAFLSLGLVFLAIFFFSGALGVMAISIHNLPYTDVFLLVAVVFTSAFFRTPAPFLLLITLMVFMNKVRGDWLPFILFLHSVTFLAGYYVHMFQKYQRFYFGILVSFFWQLLQFFLAAVLIYFFKAEIMGWLSGNSFLQVFTKVLVVYGCYQGIIILAAPILFVVTSTSLMSEDPPQIKRSQKIMPPARRGRVFSLHFSLFLLRQEFVKMSTLVHTIFKLGRETDDDEEAVNIRLKKYKQIMDRVGGELKELCFSVGKQRAYRKHIQEILNYYKTINQLELIVDDLTKVFEFLQTKDLGEEMDRECRYWLKLQLHTYEDFFVKITGVELEGEKTQDNRRKSYEVLDRIFENREARPELNDLSKVFFRITDSVDAITL